MRVPAPGLYARTLVCPQTDCANFVTVAPDPSPGPTPAPARAPGPAVAMATFEFQNFGAIRELVGPHGVHALLSQAAGRVQAVLAQCALAAIDRASITVTMAMDAPGEIEAGLRRAHAALARPVVHDSVPFRLTAHVGWAAPDPAITSTEQAERAAMAAWSAKIAGVPLRAFDAGKDRTAQVPDIQMLRDLPPAMAAGETRLEYQPKVDARTGLPHSLEALMRWTRADGRPVAVGHLIGLTEHTGYIRELTDWALRRALEDGRVLAAAGFALPIHVNVSAPLMADDGFVDSVLALLGAGDAPGTGRLGLELTETAAINDKDQVRRNLVRLAEAGIHVAIDDYGSGQCSLAYLKGLPVRELKIDRLFVSELTRCNRDPLIVRSTIDLAHALEMEVTAEGVEDPVAAALLAVMGCDLLQGFQICPPLPIGELIAFLQKESTPAASPASLLRRLNAG